MRDHGQGYGPTGYKVMRTTVRMSAIGLNLGYHSNTCDQHLTDVSAHIRGSAPRRGSTTTSRCGRIAARAWRS